MVLGLIFPLITAYNLTVFLSYSLAGIFMYLFLNEYKLEKAASFTAGLIFMFSGSLIAHKSHLVLLNTVIWLPLILLFLEKFFRSKRFEFLLLASIVYSIAFFGGAIHTFLIISLILLIFIVFKVFFSDYGSNYYFLYSLIIFIIGFLIVLAQALPAIELVSLARSEKLSYEGFTLNSYNPKMAVTLFFPYIFGFKHNLTSAFYYPHWFGYDEVGEVLRYFGIFTIPVFIFGFFKKDKNKYLWFFLLFISIFLLTGKYNPLYKIVYYIPVLNLFHFPARDWLEFSFAFAIICGFGFNDLVKADNKKFKNIISGIIIFFTFVLASFSVFYFLFKYSLKDEISGFFSSFLKKEFLSESIDISNYAVYMPLIIIGTLIVFLIIFLYKRNKITYALLIIFIFLDLLSVGRVYDDNTKNIILNKSDYEDGFIYKENKEESFRVFVIDEIPEKDLFKPNMNVQFGLESIDGYEPLFLNDYSDMFMKKFINYGLIWSEDYKKYLINNNLLSVSNCKYIALSKEHLNDYINHIREQSGGSDSGLEDYEIIYEANSSIILENKKYQPRFYFAGKLINVQNIDEAKDIIWDDKAGDVKFDPSSDVIAENINFENTSFEAQNNRLEIISSKNNSIELDISAQENSFLVFSDTFYPGWRAYVDGKETEIYRTNGLFKGIYIPAGKHMIVFNFMPSHFILYSTISLISFSGCILTIIILIARRRRKSISISGQ